MPQIQLTLIGFQNMFGPTIMGSPSLIDVCSVVAKQCWERFHIFKGRLKFPSYFRASSDDVILFLVNTQQPTRFDVMSSEKQEYSTKDEDTGKKLLLANMKL